MRLTTSAGETQYDFHMLLWVPRPTPFIVDFPILVFTHVHTYIYTYRRVLWKRYKQGMTQ